jgi:hypothetical protein
MGNISPKWGGEVGPCSYLYMLHVCVCVCVLLLCIIVFICRVFKKFNGVILWSFHVALASLRLGMLQNIEQINPINKNKEIVIKKIIFITNVKSIV